MKKISANMLKVLNDIRRGINPYFNCYTRSQESGLTRTLKALVERGYLDDKWKLTESGKDLFSAAKLLTTFTR